MEAHGNLRLESSGSATAGRIAVSSWRLRRHENLSRADHHLPLARFSPPLLRGLMPSPSWREARGPSLFCRGHTTAQSEYCRRTPRCVTPVAPGSARLTRVIPFYNTAPQRPWNVAERVSKKARRASSASAEPDKIPPALDVRIIVVSSELSAAARIIRLLIHCTRGGVRTIRAQSSRVNVSSSSDSIKWFKMPHSWLASRPSGRRTQTPMPGLGPPFWENNNCHHFP